MTSPKAVFIDIDNTIIKGTSINILVKFCYERNILNKKILIRAGYWYLLYKLNLIKDFAHIVEKTSFILEDLLKSMPAQKLNDIMQECFSKEIEPNVYPETSQMLRNFDKQGYKIYFISSTIKPMADLLQKYFGFGNVVATELEMENGFYNGKIKGKVCFGTEKLKRIEEITKEEGYDLGICYAFSDHISDIPMLEKVAHPVIINPNRKFKTIAKKRGWEVKSIKL